MTWILTLPRAPYSPGMLCPGQQQCHLGLFRYALRKCLALALILTSLGKNNQEKMSCRGCWVQRESTHRALLQLCPGEDGSG